MKYLFSVEGIKIDQQFENSYYILKCAPYLAQNSFQCKIKLKGHKIMNLKKYGGNNMLKIEKLHQAQSLERAS